MTDQPLLITLVAVQFIVHALGWSMVSHLTQRWSAAEGHYAAFWLLLATGLLSYVPLLPSGSWPRNLGNVLIVAAMVIQHRGMALYWDQRPRDRAYAALLATMVLVIAASLAWDSGHGLRVAAVCVGVGLMLLGTVHLIWHHGRTAMPAFSAILACSFGVLALALLARAVQALLVGGQTKISIDAPGHSNVPLAILVMFVGGLVNLAHIRMALVRVMHRLTVQAQTDALTGAINRRGIMLQLDQLHARAARGEHVYVVLMLDIDHFKSVNDTYGHAEGDLVLQRVARNLHEGLRVGDIVARWGGEEFCVLLPRTRLAEGQSLAERITRDIATGGTPRITVSIGVAEARAQVENMDEVIRRADAALYRAKDAGRNRVVLATEVALPVQRTVQAT